MSDALRAFWYAASRIADELVAAIDSVLLSAWLAAITGHWPRALRADGLPQIRLHPSSGLRIGDGVRLISRGGPSPVGGTDRVVVWVGPAANVSIGDGAGLSHAVVVCLERIEIGRGVLIGGGARILDSDFHRPPGGEDPLGPPATRAIRIEDDVFVGAYSTILKGVTIGRGAVIGAAAVVTSDVPPYEIWGGNPARRIGYVATATVGSR